VNDPDGVPDADRDADGSGSDRPGRRPNHRSDPAAMRETLDAARRRLGPAVPGDGPPQTAARQRALLREAVANHAVPLGTGPTTATPSTSADPSPAAADGADPVAPD